MRVGLLDPKRVYQLLNNCEKNKLDECEILRGVRWFFSGVDPGFLFPLTPLPPSLFSPDFCEYMTIGGGSRNSERKCWIYVKY